MEAQVICIIDSVLDRATGEDVYCNNMQWVL